MCQAFIYQVFSFFNIFGLYVTILHFVLCYWKVPRGSLIRVQSKNMLK